jgi:3'(2'), 5'-bisphosphate nucleotidase
MREIGIKNILEIAKLAGMEILKIYSDKSLFNVNIPLLSEEGKDIPYDIRKYWDEFWLVDPLDGTKEFIKRNGEFTVNIALIVEGYPVLGVIYAPVLNIFYIGEEGRGAYKINRDQKIKIEVLNKKKEKLIAVRSRSHASPEEEDIFQKYNVTEFTSVGSSLKFCMVAEGKADIYYRHGPTMEWDTGAGQAIIENAGLYMTNIESNERFSYNKPSLLNPGFLVM